MFSRYGLYLMRIWLRTRYEHRFPIIVRCVSLVVDPHTELSSVYLRLGADKYVSIRNDDTFEDYLSV